MRKITFQTGDYIHIFNRGVDNRNIFSDEADFLRFLEGMKYFNDMENVGSLYKLKRKLITENEEEATKSRRLGRNLVAFVAYCLNSNHYHFLVQQLEEKGVEKFMHRLGMGYTGYFNTKYFRSGALFQGTYKAVRVGSTYELARVTAYINGNPEIHGIAKAEDWIWSSCRDYFGLRNGTMCDKVLVLEQFAGVGEYLTFMREVIKESICDKETLRQIILE